MSPQSLPAISVCMPCYNASAYIEECMRSILSQSFTDFELLVADDGSSDDTVEKIRSFSDSRIRLFEREHGYIETLNFLVRQASGKYVARMDSDDRMLPDRLLIQYNYMEHHPDIAMLGGGMRFMGDRRGVFVPDVLAGPVTLADMLRHNVISHPTVLIRTSALRQLPVLYESDYIYAEDYKLWMVMLQAGLAIENLPDLLIEYRVSDGQNSTLHRKRQEETVRRIQAEYSLVVKKT